jgi:hypothetical protein
MYIVKVDKQKAIYNIVAGINYTISFLPYKFICCIVFIYFVHNVKNQDKSILSTFQMIPFFVRVHPIKEILLETLLLISGKMTKLLYNNNLMSSKMLLNLMQFMVKTDFYFNNFSISQSPTSTSYFVFHYLL